MARTMTAENFARLSLDAVRERAEAAGFVRDIVVRNAVIMVAPAPGSDGEIEFALPLTTAIADYALRMVDAVAAIAIVEDIEALDLMRELLAASES